MKSSLEVTDAQSAAVQKSPFRITLEDVNDSIATVEYLYPKCKPELTIAVVKMTVGYCVTGQSAPADPENFNEELGRQFALEDAKRKIWPLLGYALCENLYIDPEEDTIPY